MVQIILISLYCYIAVRAVIFLIKNFDKFTHKAWFKFLEIIFFALSLGYLFHYLYFNNQDFKNFIIPKEVLWISFIVGVMLLGIALGIRFMIDTWKSMKIHDENILTKEVHYDIFTKLWMNVNLIFLFFIFCMMEISHPLTKEVRLAELVAIYVLSFILGLIFSFIIQSFNKVIKWVLGIVFTLLIACLSLLIYEIKDFYNPNLFPITTSFLIFLLANVLGVIALVIMKKANIRIFAKNVNEETEIDNEESENKVLYAQKEFEDANKENVDIKSNVVNLIDNKIKVAGNIKPKKSKAKKTQKKTKSKKNKSKKSGMISLGKLKD